MTTLHDIYAEIEHEDDHAPDPVYTPTLLDDPPPTPKPEAVEVCRDCGEPMHTATQPAPRGKAAYTISECRNEHCGLYFVTLSARTWATITSEQLDAYRVMNRKVG